MCLLVMWKYHVFLLIWRVNTHFKNDLYHMSQTDILSFFHLSTAIIFVILFDNMCWLWLTVLRFLYKVCLLPLQEPSLYTVKAVLILDNDGDRLYAKASDVSSYCTVKLLTLIKNILKHFLFNLAVHALHTLYSLFLHSICLFEKKEKYLYVSLYI